MSDSVKSRDAIGVLPMPISLLPFEKINVEMNLTLFHTFPIHLKTQVNLVHGNLKTGIQHSGLHLEAVIHCMNHHLCVKWE